MIVWLHETFFGAASCGCSSVVEHLLAKERVESSNLFIRLSLTFGSTVAVVSTVQKKLGTDAICVFHIDPLHVA